MQPSEVDVPRSIMDPTPPSQRRRGPNKKLIGIIAAVITVLAIAGGVAFFLMRSSGSENAGGQDESAQTTTPTPTPEDDITEGAAIKQVSVEGRTFTHIVPKTWKTAGSDGDLQADTEIPASSGSEGGPATVAIRYNQGIYALNPAAPAGTHCDQMVADSEVVKVSPADERYINYCGKKNADGDIVLAYVLFTKFSYKAGKTLTAVEQTDLFQNVLMFGRIQPPDENPYQGAYETVSDIPEFQDMIEIFRSITYVEVQP